MIAQLLWFTAGFVTSMYMDEIVDWAEGVVEKLEEAVDGPPTTKEEAPGESVTWDSSKRRWRKVEDQEDLDIEELLKESLKRVGLDSKLENLNKTLGQVTSAVAEAFDKAGKSGTIMFTDKFTRNKED